MSKIWGESYSGDSSLNVKEIASHHKFWTAETKMIWCWLVTFFWLLWTGIAMVLIILSCCLCLIPVAVFLPAWFMREVARRHVSLVIMLGVAVGFIVGFYLVPVGVPFYLHYILGIGSGLVIVAISHFFLKSLKSNPLVYIWQRLYVNDDDCSLIDKVAEAILPSSLL
jgi:hypothetical protein